MPLRPSAVVEASQIGCPFGNELLAETHEQ
jgi:hypothetical protein